jgi:phage terminase small subunit
MKITPKQEKFCIEYLKTGNKSEAYRLAYNAENMSDETIHNKAYALSDKSKVRARIEEIQKEVNEKELYTIEQSIKRDLRLLERYENALSVLENKDSKDKEITAAERTIKFIGSTGYNSVQDRLSEQHGFYEISNIQKQAQVANIINLGSGINPEEIKMINKALEEEY